MMDIESKKQRYWREDAERGSILAMLCLAESYMGRPWEKVGDLEKVYYWYEQAARHGSGEGMYELGRLAERVGATDEAWKRYKQAAVMGWPEAWTKVGEYCKSRGNKKQARRWFELAADYGESLARRILDLPSIGEEDAVWAQKASALAVRYEKRGKRERADRYRVKARIYGDKSRRGDDTEEQHAIQDALSAQWRQTLQARGVPSLEAKGLGSLIALWEGDEAEAFRWYHRQLSCLGRWDFWEEASGLWIDLFLNDRQDYICNEQAAIAGNEDAFGYALLTGISDEGRDEQYWVARQIDFDYWSGYAHLRYWDEDEDEAPKRYKKSVPYELTGEDRLSDGNEYPAEPIGIQGAISWLWEEIYY
ncbi:MAG: hypothetical protein MR209_05690 [Veillonellaceae bacterium]|nr:hypothetical protein [Veillonellaceae bacterium]